MPYVSLYRRFRPNTFDGVIGQDHITRTLTNQIKSGNIGHAYLFTGTRGTGKTSCAKIFARAVNCLRPQNGSPCGECEVCKALANQNNIDILEIDAASNNGVDEIRTLKENVMYRPTVGRYKVYIIDEVHMLTASAFNALLKTLEEPPEHVVFILATTEVYKIPQTILSRCLRFDFRLVEEDKLVGLLKKIFDEMGVGYEETALRRIAVSGEGSVRDTLSVADMCMSYCGGDITTNDVLEILCATDFGDLDALSGAILNGDCASALNVLDRLLKNGRTTVYKDLARYFSDLIAIKNVSGYRPDTVSEHELELMRQRTEHSNYRISRVADIMTELENKIRFSTQPRILLEASVVRACELVTELNLDGLTQRVTELENKLKELQEKGVLVQASPARPPLIPNTAESSLQTIIEEKKSPIKEESAVDIGSLLSEIATESTEEAPIFDDDDGSDVDVNATDIWTRIITDLHDLNEINLYMTCNGIEGKNVSIVGTDFIVQTDDNFSLELFSRPNNADLMQRLVTKEAGNYSFIVRQPMSKKGISNEDKLTLNRLFNGTIKMKP